MERETALHGALAGGLVRWVGASETTNRGVSSHKRPPEPQAITLLLHTTD